MDFSPAAAAAAPPGAGGAYARLAGTWLPPLFLVWGAPKEGDSGRVHAPLAARWAAGEPGLAAPVARLAGVAREGAAALGARDVRRCAALFDENLALRRALLAPAGLPPSDEAAVSAVRGAGAAAKLAGSGGAVLACLRDGGGGEAAEEAALRGACAAAGLRCERLVLHSPAAAGDGGEQAAACP